MFKLCCYHIVITKCLYVGESNQEENRFYSTNVFSLKFHCSPLQVMCSFPMTYGPPSVQVSWRIHTSSIVLYCLKLPCMQEWLHFSMPPTAAPKAEALSVFKSIIAVSSQWNSNDKSNMQGVPCCSFHKAFMVQENLIKDCWILQKP